MAPATAAAASEEVGLGLTLRPLSPTLRTKLELPQDLKGAAVLKVEPGSPADSAGILPDDVIVGVGTTAVMGPREVARAIGRARQSPSHVVLLRIFRDGRARFVAIDLASSK